MAHATVSAFNAGSSMLGYLYQVRVALLWAIKKSREGDFMVCKQSINHALARGVGADARRTAYAPPSSRFQGSSAS